ncbi:MAG: peptidoglycan binding domain-containing protein [Eubacterium sp.]
MNGDNMNQEDKEDVLNFDQEKGETQVESEHDSEEKPEIEREEMVITEKGKMKKSKKIGIIIATIVGLLLVIYLGTAFYFNSHFYFNSTINYINVAGKTPEEVDATIRQNAENYQLTLNERGNMTEQITSNQVKINYATSNEIFELFKEQNPFAWPLSLLSSGHRDLVVKMAFDDNLLTNQLTQLVAISGDKVVKVQNAYPKYNGETFEIVPEIEGNEIDQEILKKKVTEAILSGKQTLDLESEGCYKKPTYRKDTPKVSETMKKMNQLSGVVVTYTFGEKTEIPDKNTVSSWMHVDDNMDVAFDPELVGQYVETLSEKYDTYGMTRSFNTSGGGVVSVAGGDYGWLIDKEAEINALIDAIQAGQNVTREPIYASTAVSHGASDMGNTYVEISLGGQHMWFYKNGSLIVDTDIVTGNAGGGFGTPSGTFGLDYKAHNVTLKGDGYASPVTFWMPYDGDIGIHDASWRSEYGGTIYQANGSHGCVNTPYAAAQRIFDSIEENDPVIVY